MKLKIFRIFGIAITVFVILVSAIIWGINTFGSDNQNQSQNQSSDSQLGKSYEEALHDDKPMVLLFYSDWCAYCQKFEPKYKFLSELYGNKFNFVKVNADNPKYQKVLNDFAIGGLPTLYIVDPTIDDRVLISNTIMFDLFRLRAELDRYLRIRSMIKK